MDKFLAELPRKHKAEDEASQNVLPKQFPSKAKTRKYEDTYLVFGFTCSLQSQTEFASAEYWQKPAEFTIHRVATGLESTRKYLNKIKINQDLESAWIYKEVLKSACIWPFPPPDLSHAPPAPSDLIQKCYTLKVWKSLSGLSVICIFLWFPMIGWLVYINMARFHPDQIKDFSLLTPGWCYCHLIKINRSSLCIVRCWVRLVCEHLCELLALNFEIIYLLKSAWNVSLQKSGNPG